jgi:protein SCO1
MKLQTLLTVVALHGWLLSCGPVAAEPGALRDQPQTNVQTFTTTGVVRELKTDGRTLVVTHEKIAGFMDAMTMPFRVREPAELAGLRAGDKIQFCLRVTDTESWIDHITKTGWNPAEDAKPATAPAPKAREVNSRHLLLTYSFTNELGQALRLGDFRGQALGITFFFTRCPIPDYCPRLSKNFEEASRKLSAMPGGPTNWHFLSVTFDPEFDTPGILKAYGERYEYDPTHWSFVTGPKEKIGELARASDVKFEAAAGFIDHNFRTLIIDAAGHLQMGFPTGGNLSDAIVAEIIKAAVVPGAPSKPSDREAQPQRTAFAR